MKEVTYRRYYRALVEESELPELILADGGITQVYLQIFSATFKGTTSAIS